MNALKATGLFASLLAIVFSNPALSVAEPAPPLPMAQGKGFTQEGIGKIDAYFAEQIATNQTPGAVLAVAKNGKLVIYKSYGYLDKASNKPMTKDAIFNLASMTKVMAAVSVVSHFMKKASCRSMRPSLIGFHNLRIQK